MSRFVICIDNRANPASLIFGKVYHRLSDAEAETHDMIRVVDEDTSDRTAISIRRRSSPRSSCRSLPSGRWR